MNINLERERERERERGGGGGGGGPEGEEEGEEEYELYLPQVEFALKLSFLISAPTGIYIHKCKSFKVFRDRIAKICRNKCSKTGE